jgi:acetyltransferase-like isoleucine patch superfamily enzyme
MTTIGAYTYGQPEVVLPSENNAQLTIGRFCSIAANVRIFLDGEHRPDWITTYPFPAFGNVWPEAKDIKNYRVSKGNVIIGNDVWIGEGAWILSGVEIGDGAVIGAGSLITKNVEPYSIMGGNPARIIRKRFDDLTIRKLLQIKWWDWPPDKIRSNLTLLCSPQTDRFIALHAGSQP